MFQFRRQLTPPRVAIAPPAVPPGQRVYAIGDVHGRLDLLVPAIDAVRADMAAAPAERAFLVFLGDLIDRGPASRQVVDLLRRADWSWITPVFLLGNHEEAMLAAYDGDLIALRDWTGFGGAETAESYGVSAVHHDCRSYWQALRDAIPREHIAFLRSFRDRFTLGDYLFVHAGIRPGVPIDRQHPRDLRWIREEFLDCRDHHGKVIVHGHTIVDAPELLPNRIGIDTGAYRTSRLTKLRLEGGQQVILDKPPAESATTKRVDRSEGP